MWTCRWPRASAGGRGSVPAARPSCHAGRSAGRSSIDLAARLAALLAGTCGLDPSHATPAAHAEHAGHGAPASAAWQAPPAQAVTIALLAVRLNGVELSHEVEVHRSGPTVALSHDGWQRLRLKPSLGRQTVLHEGRAFRLLDSASLAWHVEEASQTLVIQAPPTAFVDGTLVVGAPPAAAAAPAGRGAFVNYEVQSRQGPGSARASSQLLLEGSTFGPTLGSSGALASSALVQRGLSRTTATRLDTTWTLEDPARLAQLRLGDAISQPGTWGRALRYGGVQWSTDFSLRPGFQPSVQPVLRGEAALPSTVDVYVDNVRRVQGRVEPGAFEVAEVPVINGRGEVRMVVRDLLGREQVIVQPYFAHAALLRPGLRAVSAELGVARRDWGLASGAYGPPLATYTDRLGVDDTFTREWRLEWSARQRALGASGSWLLPAGSLLQAGGAASESAAGGGTLFFAAAEHQAQHWTGNAQWRWANRRFVQLGQAAGALPMRSSLAVALGRSWPELGLGASLVEQAPWQGRRQQLVAVNGHTRLGAAGTLSLFVAHDRLGGGAGVSLLWQLALGGGDSVAWSSARRAGGGDPLHTAQWQTVPVHEAGAAVHVEATRGEWRRDAAQLAWDGDRARLVGAVVHAAQGTEVRAGAGGSVAWLGESVFVGRRIDDSFAIVDVGGHAGVAVLHDHRPVARTDVHGRALVTGLRGREVNHLSVDAGELPLMAEVQSLELAVVPPARSGVAVALPLRSTRSARFRLVDAGGQPLPPGSHFTLDGDEAQRRFPVGFDGLAFATGQAARHTAIALLPSGRACRAELRLPEPRGGGGLGEAHNELPDLGDQVCR